MRGIKEGHLEVFIALLRIRNSNSSSCRDALKSKWWNDGSTGFKTCNQS